VGIDTGVGGEKVELEGHGGSGAERRALEIARGALKLSWDKLSTKVQEK
jgi:hypothetical protein